MTLANYAKANRSKVFNLFSVSKATGFVYVRGGKTIFRQWTDVEEPFRQESNFFYLTGVTLPDHHVLLDLERKQTILVIPKYDDDYALWCGAPPTVDSSMREVNCFSNKSQFIILFKYGVDKVVFDCDFNETLSENPGSIHTLAGTDLSSLSDYLNRIDESILKRFEFMFPFPYFP